jgi:TonB-dependent SusC/RagA subfamily outer membrane receptor
MKYFITVATGILLASSMLAQTRVVHGRLTAFNKYPVENIEISSKKGRSAAMSDSLGRFSIVCMENDVIRIKSKTFRQETRKVRPGTDSLIVNLIFLNSKKNREIAVGYGYLMEDDLLYAIDNLQHENNEFCIYNNVYDVIKGRFAGVDVENGAVIIRGGNTFHGSDEALYVVDGFTVSSIDWVIPCEIKSISILKDASAATYGSRGANGVVIIELLKGNLE